MRRMTYTFWPLSSWPPSSIGSTTNETNFENTP
jgi:hypothetical protein